MAVKHESYLVTNPDLYTRVYKDHYKTLRHQVARYLGDRNHHSFDEIMDKALERACQQVEKGLMPNLAARSAVSEYRSSSRSKNISYDQIAHTVDSDSQAESDSEDDDFLDKQYMSPFAPRDISEHVNLNNYGENPAEQVAKQEILDALEVALDTLPYPTSAVLSLYYLEEKKQYQIGRQLSLSPYKVAYHLDKGVELLRENKQLVLKRRKKHD
jgi:RNA polymerase sigma factor (sigma-70 family)